MSQNFSQNVFVSRQIFATARALVIRAPETAVAKLRSFATEPGYPGSSGAGQSKEFEILSPQYLPLWL